jgi:predicted metal-dependent HD superfamily phosphohydrolase
MTQCNTNQRDQLLLEAIKINMPRGIFEQLIFAYSSQNRQYHNLNHLISVLTEASVAIPLLTKFEMDSLLVALWFHDSIQQSTLKSFLSDEELSAAWMVKSCTGHYPTAVVAQAEKLIELTGKHVSANGTLDNVSGIMICCDLAILGYDSTAYKIYSSQIREEYPYLSHNVFAKGRLGVLRGLLKKAQNNTLFPHPLWSSLYNAQAVRNISAEIDHLSTKDQE